ncbi:MAG TPA: sulfotransferase [Thermoanaerobaculia bacterium]
MSLPKPLFVTGNKRSGSTVLTDLLNVHPEVFVSHESDIAWILFQAREGPPDRFRAHPLDSTLMMSSTVRDCGRILRSTLGDRPGCEEVAEAFHRVQARLMKRYLRPSLKQRLKRIAKVVGKKPTPGRLWRALRQKPELRRKGDLAWTGDKKHAQMLDPEVRDFLGATFPEARYIHIVRHPRGVVASTLEAARKWSEAPAYFHGTAESVLEQWAALEEWGLQAKEANGGLVHVLRLEDLWSDPLPVLSRVLDFLGLEMTETFADLVPRMVYRRDPNEKYASFPLPEVPRAARIMEIYGYQDA